MTQKHVKGVIKASFAQMGLGELTEEVTVFVLVCYTSCLFDA